MSYNMPAPWRHYDPYPNTQYDPYFNTYNSGWQDHRDFSYEWNYQHNFDQNWLPEFQPQYQPTYQQSSSSGEISLEDIVKSMAENTKQLQQSTMQFQQSSYNEGSSLEDLIRSLAVSTTQFQQETRSSMKNLENQLSQLTTAFDRLESHMFEKLSSQSEENLENVSTMTSRSGEKVEGPRPMISQDINEEYMEKKLEEEGSSDDKVISNSFVNIESNTPHFPNRLEKPREIEKEKEILKLLDVGIIFAITDSPWVRLNQVVPKKAGTIVLDIQEGAMIQIRKQIRWRQYIDYPKLNSVTKQDQFL